jgi:hypothetical protein
VLRASHGVGAFLAVLGALVGLRRSPDLHPAETGRLTVEQLQELGRSSVLTVEQVQELLRRADESIWAWYIEYHAKAGPHDSGRLGPPVHRVVAAERPSYYLAWTRKSSPYFDWQDDPLQQRMTLNGDEGMDELPASRAFHRFTSTLGGQLPGSGPQELMFLVLGWWPLTERQSPKPLDGRPVVLKDVYTSPQYELRPQQELVDGHWCHVLENVGRDRLWVDCDRGGVVLKREVLIPSGAVLTRVRLKRLREHHPGLWVPGEVETERYDNPRVAGDALPMQSLIRIVDIRVNEEVSHACFEFCATPGALQFWDTGEIIEVRPGEDEFMENVGAWIQSHFPKSAADSRTTESVIEGLLAVACIAGFAVLQLRPYEKRGLKRKA